MDNRFKLNNYLIRKKILTFVGSEFHIYDREGGNIIFYAKLKPFQWKEDIRIYTGEDKQTELLMIKARKAIDFSATYDVFDSSSGQKIGALRRKGWKSMLQDEWQILDTNDAEIGLISEDSALLALLRRFLTELIPQEFHVTMNGQQVMHVKQNFNPFVSKINIDFSQDTSNLLDRRIGIAAGLLLNAIEGKQG